MDYVKLLFQGIQESLNASKVSISAPMIIYSEITFTVKKHP